MDRCGVCDPCEKNCGNNCNDPCRNDLCFRWGFDGCFLRARCKNGQELPPLDLCKWLKVHETCTELLLVPEVTENWDNSGYLLYKNECGEEYKIWVCDFLSLGSIRCLKDVYEYPDPDPNNPDAVRPCDLFVYNPNCITDPTDPRYHKWVPYHIPDAGDCVIQPDSEGYSKVLIKDECGCIRECKLFVQQNTYEYALRDSWADDPDEDFHAGTWKGNNSEIIDINLERVPMFGVTDLEVTIQYAFGIQNHVFGTNWNIQSQVVPTNAPNHNPSLSDQWSKSIVVQGSNLSPFGSWEWQVSRTFIIPKGEKLFLTHNVIVHDMSANEVPYIPDTPGKHIPDAPGSWRLHALHVFVRATKGVKL